MSFSLSAKVLSIALVCSASLLGYAMMSGGAGNAVDYDLAINNIPVEFDGNKTLYLDTQTNDRSFLIYNDYLQIRSQYLTYYDLNNSYEHEDVNLVIGDYCYTPAIPAQNATLDSVTMVDRFTFHAHNGTVSVKTTEYTSSRMTLEINSTDENATLLIQANSLTYGHEYRVIIDGDTQGWLRVNWDKYFQYNYSAGWSNHTVTFQDIASVTMVPNTYLQLTQTFLILGLWLSIAKYMVLPMKDRKMRPQDMQKTVVKAMVYIVVGTAFIMVTFKMFIGV